MPFVVLVLLALVVGVVVFLAAVRYPARGRDPATAASVAAGEALAEAAETRPWLRRTLARRLDPEAATGLALTVGLTVAIVGGLVLGVLAFLMRSSGTLVSLDRSVGAWGHDHATHWSTQLLQVVTDLASAPVAIAVVLIVGVVETIRVRNRLVIPFLVAVFVGEVLIVNSVKHLLHRVRPTFNPIAAHLGPSFPSGHSATAAAVYAAVALVLARRRPQLVRAILFGTAAAIAAAVACSRVMLGVHWMSDTIAGVAFGWAWFAACAVAFGGGLLDFGRPVEQAAREAAVTRRTGGSEASRTPAADGVRRREGARGGA